MIENPPPQLPITSDGPRAIRKRAGRGSALGCVQLFLVPHTLAGLFLLVMAIHATVNLGFGANVRGIVTSRDTYFSSKSTRPSYRIRFAYDVAGSRHVSSANVGNDEWLIYPPESSIMVRVLPWAPDLDPVPMTQPDAALRSTGKWWLFALFWCGLMSLFWWGVYVVPWANKRLIAVGHAVTGVVTNKRVSFNKTTIRTVKYRYTPDGSAFERSGARERGGSMTVASAAYSSVQEGSPVTALYFPNAPWLSTVYELSDYEVAP